MVKLEHVSFSYSLKGKALPVLRDINFQVEKGSITAIVGQSGCGKTTLLRLIAGLNRQDGGTITLGESSGSADRPNISIIFQNYGLLPWKTVKANAELGLLARGAKGRIRSAAVAPILEELGLSGFSRLFPVRLSGGMQQRVAIARALATNSDILLLDEPFSSLDANTRESLQDMLLATQKRHGTTVVLVTHSIEEAVYVADTVYIVSGKNPSTIVERMETARKTRAFPAGLSKPLSISHRGKSDDSALPYRESAIYFQDVARLRQRFSEAAESKQDTALLAESEGSQPAGIAGTAVTAGSTGKPWALNPGLKKFGNKLFHLAFAMLFAGLLWQLAAASVQKAFLPPPLSALRRLFELIASGNLNIHTLQSLKRIFLSLGIAGPLAWVLGLLSGRHRTIDAVTSPIVYLLHPLPKVAFLPVLMLFFGLGDASKVALMGLVIFSQLFVGARDASRAIPQSMIDTVRSLGGSTSFVTRQVILPSTWPALISSLRISLGTASAVLFLSETFASMDGLGWYIMDAWSRVDYLDMYAAILTLSLVILILFLLLDLVETITLRWRELD